jgi:hypothetical protein
MIQLAVIYLCLQDLKERAVKLYINFPNTIKFDTKGLYGDKDAILDSFRLLIFYF